MKKYCTANCNIAWAAVVLVAWFNHSEFLFETKLCHKKSPSIYCSVNHIVQRCIHHCSGVYFTREPEPGGETQSRSSCHTQCSHLSWPCLRVSSWSSTGDSQIISKLEKKKRKRGAVAEQTMLFCSSGPIQGKGKGWYGTFVSILS